MAQTTHICFTILKSGACHEKKFLPFVVVSCRYAENFLYEKTYTGSKLVGFQVEIKNVLPLRYIC
jgi:hypothetical protein